MPTRYPRVNIVVTEEQHALLSELAELERKQGNASASASGFVRQLLDQVTPLLRKTVPLMRAAAEELDTGRESLRAPLREFLAELQQHDLLDLATSADARTERSDGARGRPRPARRKS